MEVVNINFNSYAEVKLTDFGLKVLKDTPFTEALQKQATENDGVIKDQLWSIMSIFGEYLIMGNPEPFSMDFKVFGYTKEELTP